MIRNFILALALLSSFTGNAVAKEAAPLAEDPAIEARMLEMAQELRCLVCQNQTVAASDSDFSNDIRREMRAMMKKGMSNEQIRDFLVQRYGDFILFKPPVKTKTLPLWFGPIVLLIIGTSVLVLMLRRRNRGGLENASLSEADHQRAAALLQQDSASSAAGDNNTSEGRPT